MKRFLGGREQLRKENSPYALAAWPRTPITLAARGLIFADADVLFDDSHWLRWLHNQLRREQCVATFDNLCQAWNTVSGEFLAGRIAFADALHALFDSMVISPTLRAELAVVAQTRRERLAADCRPFAGTAQALNGLADSGFLLAVLANCELPGEALCQRLNRQGLCHFNVIVTSNDLGHARPAAGAYLGAVAQMQLPVEDVIYVGAHEHDLAAAEAAGLRGISCSSDDVECRLRVSSLDELARHVAARRPLKQAG